MDDVTFAQIVNGLHDFPSFPTVLFGGFGEPLLHPHIADMVAQVKALGIPVELITNGTLLTEDLSRHLITAGLDVLWVSLDGATAESFADVRPGGELSEIVENVTRFRNIHWTSQGLLPHIGIIFVAMDRNIADLPAVAAIFLSQTRKIVLAMSFPPAAAVYGRRGLFNAHKQGCIFNCRLQLDTAKKVCLSTLSQCLS